MTNILLPETSREAVQDSSVTRYDFPEGTSYLEVRLGDKDPLTAVTNADGLVIDKPEIPATRRPSREMVVQSAMAYYAMHDQLPAAFLA